MAKQVKKILADQSALKKAVKIISNTAGENSSCYGSYCVHKGFNRGSEVVRTCGDNHFIQLAVRPRLTGSDYRRTLQLTSAKNGVIVYLETIINCFEDLSPRNYAALLPSNFDFSELFGEENFVTESKGIIKINSNRIAEYNSDYSAQLINGIEFDLRDYTILLNHVLTANIPDNSTPAPIAIISAAGIRELSAGKIHIEDKNLKLAIYPEGAGIYSEKLGSFVSSTELDSFNLDYSGKDSEKIFNLNRRQFRQISSSLKGVSLDFNVFNFNNYLKLEYKSKNVFLAVIAAENLESQVEIEGCDYDF